MRLIAPVIALALLPACPNGPKPTPTPTPVPTPTPKQVKYEYLVLRQNGGNLTRNGQPHKLFGAIPCWDPEGKDHGGWAGFANSWVDYAVAKGANSFHMRLGPFKTDKPDEQGNPPPSNGLMYGMGPYINDDWAQGFNQPWWDRAVAMCDYAGSKGANCEIDLIDGWACKHAVWGDFEMPWSEADIKACGNSITEVHKQFLRKAVEEFGCYANVVWQDGNEIGQSAQELNINVFGLRPSRTRKVQAPLKYSPQWSLEMVDLVRQYEQEVGCGVVHMFGTNSDNDEVELSPKIDYTSTHAKTAIDGPYAGKFRQNNEHNPPFTPEGEQYMFCKAQNAGQAWWYWRGAQTQSDMEKTLTLFSQGCDGVPTTGCPFPVKPTAKIKCKPHGMHGGYPLYDCTPLNSANQPIWPEGDAELRSECEIKSMGDLPTFEIAAPLSIHHMAHGGMAFAVAGHGSAKVTCSIPKQPSNWQGCVDTNLNPLVVTVP